MIAAIHQVSGFLPGCFDAWCNKASSQHLEGHEAQQLGSLARDQGIERGIEKEAAICSSLEMAPLKCEGKIPF